MKQFIVDIGLDSKELPDLPVLEGNLQNVASALVCERPYLRIVDLNRGHVERRDKVRTVLNLLFALSAEHHRKNLGCHYTPNKCTVNQSILNIGLEI